jgi:hypothetical protein
MLASIPSKLFIEWQAFFRLEPFGEWRGDFRAAQIAQVIANVNRDSKKQRDPFTVQDFMPDFIKRDDFPDQPVPLEVLKKKMQAIASAFKKNPRIKKGSTE